MHIRKMLPKDIDYAIRLTSNEGWSSIGLDFEELLSFDPLGCFVGEINDKPIGMICTISYNGFGFVSNLIVDPEYRNNKYGSFLLEHALEYLEKRRVKTQMLDGMQKAISLYERFGFEKRHKSLRLEGHVEPKESNNIRPMTHDDLDSIDRFDAIFFGATRRRLLQSQLKHFPNLCRVAENDGDLTGYIMGTERQETIRIGPWVMKENLEQAEDLLMDFASEIRGKRLKIGVLENSRACLHILQKHDFVQKSFSWRMLRGNNGNWTFSDHLYAICSAARG
ncbi:MAG: GNAT family N-acetyltransferase [Promethearchaeota archaeon]